jgi:DNA-binding NarL/FixJ family response regulator
VNILHIDAHDIHPPGSGALRVMIVEDHELFRSGLAGLLGERGVNVVAMAASGEAALEMAGRTHPDVVLMDVGLPGISGVETTQRLLDAEPELPVVILTVWDDEDKLVDAILAGACGYLLKNASIDEIAAGVEAAARGESLIAPPLARKLLRRIHDQRGEVGSPRPRLSKREFEVLEQLIEGRDNAEIAQTLFISQHTVKKHVSRILAELGVDNRVQAAVRAARGWKD